MSIQTNYCNDSTILDHGYVCCDSKICAGYCHKFNSSNEDSTWTYTEMCFTNIGKFTCIDTYGIFAWALLFVFPTLLALIINPCLRTHASYVSLLSGLIINLSLVFIIIGSICLTAEMTAPLVCFILGVSIFPCAYIFSRLNFCNCFHGIECLGVNGGCCKEKQDYSIEAQRAQQEAIIERECKCCGGCCYECCYKCNVGCFDKTLDEGHCSWCKGTNDILAVSREIRSPYVTKDELRDVIYENLSIPPIPEVTAQAFYVSSNGRSQQNVVYDSATQEVDYMSWEDNTPQVTIAEEPIVVYHCKLQYVFDQNMNQSIENAKAVAEGNVSHKDYVCSFLPNRLSGLTTDVVAGDERNSFVKCCRSWPVSRFLYEVLFFLGYHSLLEIVWRSHVTIISHRITKHVSNEPGLRAQKGERDPGASSVGFGIHREDTKDESLIYGMA